MSFFWILFYVFLHEINWKNKLKFSFMVLKLLFWIFFILSIGIKWQKFLKATENCIQVNFLSFKIETPQNVQLFFLKFSMLIYVNLVQLHRKNLKKNFYQKIIWEEPSKITLLGYRWHLRVNNRLKTHSDSRRTRKWYLKNK